MTEPTCNHVYTVPTTIRQHQREGGPLYYNVEELACELCGETKRIAHKDRFGNPIIMNQPYGPDIRAGLMRE